MPATYAVCRTVLDEVAARLAPAQIVSLLDLGAGLGSMLWAAADVLPALESATLVEADAAMLRLGSVLAAEEETLPKAGWVSGDLRSQPLAEHDLVTFSYSLGELAEKDAAKVLELAWRAAGRALVIIEPGMPAGFERVRRWRDQLLKMGAHMMAPCPHTAPCPLNAPDWCHFAQRVERTSLHRRLKGGELGHEDEKFSYIAVSREPAALPSARIIRHPQATAGAIKLELCTQNGLNRTVATKRDREEFRQARHARWGDAWEPAQKLADQADGI
jgi:ribosomal protein RSM22 (predicted rRNA methylase)